MIMDRVISHLRNSGFTVYKAGNNSDIERKPCVVIGMAGYTQPWAPLPAREKRENCVCSWVIHYWNVR